MSELIDLLSTGAHPVTTARYSTAAELGECIDRGFVLVKFTGTRGGTELGFRLDTARTKTTEADFQSGTGTVRLVGDLSLDFEKVTCVAEIDLSSLAGQGHLERVPAATASASAG